MEPTGSVGSGPLDDAAGVPSLVDALVADTEAAHRLLVEQLSDILAIHEPDGRLRWISPSVERVLGWTVEQRLDQELQLIHPEDAPRLGQVRAQLAGGADSATVRVRLLHVDGSYRWGDSTARAVRDAAGAVIALVVVTRDVHDQVLAEEALAASARQYRLLTESMKDVVWTLDPETFRFTYVSPSVLALRGFTAEEVMAEPMDATLTPQAAAWLRQGIPADLERLRAGIEPFGVFHTFEFPQPCKDGSMVWTEVVATYQPNEDTGRIEVRAVTRDITARRAAAAALARSEQLFRTAMESAPTGMAVLDLDRRFVQVNPALCRMLDRDNSWLLAHRVPDVLDYANDTLDQRMRAELVSAHLDSITGEKQLVRRDGSLVWVEQSIGLLRDIDGQPSGYVSQFVDVTEDRQARETLRYLATHDSLTRLVNRVELLTRMDAMLSRPPRTATTIATLFIDLDGLKAINDTHGHAVGDAVIVAVAERIAAQVRPDDTVARVGGDEYVVILPAIQAIDDAQRIAHRIHAAMTEPITARDRTVCVSVSIGVSLVASGQAAEQALERADRALYEAKKAGGSQTAVHRSATAQHHE